MFLDLARIIRCADAARGGLVTATTNLGLRVSASHRYDGPGAAAYHYAFSRASQALGAADAAALARIATAVGPAAGRRRRCCTAPATASTT